MTKRPPASLCLAIAAMLVGTSAPPALAQSTAPSPPATAPHQATDSHQAAVPAAPVTSPVLTPDAALLQAATGGDFIAARAALVCGANLNARDDAGRTPLMRAVFFGYPDVVNVLLDKNPDLRAVDNNGMTALGYAVNNRAAISIQQAGTAPSSMTASATAPSATPETPPAAPPKKKKHGGGFFGGLLNAGKSLLSAAAPLAMMAAGPMELLAGGGAMGLLGGGMGMLGGMGALGGALPSMMGGLSVGRGGMPGMGAVGDPAAMQAMASDPAFLQKMQDIQAKVATGQMSQAQAMQAYQDATKGMAPVPASGETAERTAQTSSVLVQALLDKGAGINDKDKQGVTPLISAARLGSTDVVKLLLSKGANITIKDARGSSALRYAKDGNHADIAELLQRMGAKE